MFKLSLSKVLFLDAVSCGAIFAIGVFAYGAVAPLLGLPEMVVQAGGWICLAAGALLAFLAANPVRPLIILAIAGNVGWVAASIAVWMAFSGELTSLGHVVVLAQAAAVALFVILETGRLKECAGARPVSL